MKHKGDDELDKKRTKTILTVSAAIAVLTAGWGILDNHSFAKAADFLMNLLKEHFSWLYLDVALFFVIFSVALALSPLGKIRLGGDDEKPEHSLFSWFAMLFGAGMGIGLVFWGISEPLSHYIAPMAGIAPKTPEAAAFSMRSCFMHWGIHPWACYAVMGLGLAYFQFRRKEKVLVSSIFKPLMGEKRVRGIPGMAIDIFTTVLTIIGVATSFGMGCLQICSGLNEMFGIPDTVVTWMIVIALICVLYLSTAISGVGKGIKYISNLNMVLFTGLMVCAFLIGPMGESCRYFLVGMKDYIINFIPDSLRMSVQGDSSWIRNWRVFYWAWWLSWAPFVGVFIARISKGRTIREFIIGVILIPSVVSAVWFAVMGGMALHVTGNFSTELLAEMVANPQTALFHIFAEYKSGLLLSLAAIVLLVTFFVTSANSATFVLAMLTSDGDLEPPNRLKVFWGILLAFLALALILSGGIQVIQTISIVIAFPYLFLLLGICACVVKACMGERKGMKETKCGGQQSI